MQFEVESVVKLTSRFQTYIVARQVTPGNWKLSPTPTLGGVPIKEWTDIPRSEYTNGKQRMDIFGFCLCDPSDISKFSIGQIIELEP